MLQSENFFRNSISLLFDIKPAVKLVFDVNDDDDTPVMVSFIIQDGIESFGHTKARSDLPWRYPWRDWESVQMEQTLITVSKVRHAPVHKSNRVKIGI